MITPAQWNSLVHLKAKDFKHPDDLDFSVVSALDRFISRIGSRPLILSDYRPGDPRQHGKGRAIDAAFPGRDPVEIHREALAARLFSGIGIYVNEAKVGSHHFDTRTDKTPAAPATWGGLISHPYDTAKADHIKRIEYTTAQAVIDTIKKKGAALASSPLTWFAVILSLLLWTQKKSH